MDGSVMVEAKQPSASLPMADAIAGPVQLSAEARTLLREGQLAGAFQALLRRQGLLADAIRFTAAYLPRRSAVWWGCLCLWERQRTESTAAATAALQATVAWVLDPTDARRRAAGEAAQAAGPGTPAGQLAQAVFCCGGSLAPPGLPIVSPSASLTPNGVAGAILQASRQAPARQHADWQKRFLDLAQELATLPAPWESHKR
jgi:hypothetical protein